MRTILTTLVCLGCFAASSVGAISYKFEFNTTAVDVPLGGMTTLDIYLVETVSGGDTSLWVDDEGLFSAQVSVIRGNVAGVIEPAEITDAAYHIVGPDDPTGFDDPEPLIGPFSDFVDFLIFDGFGVTPVVGEVVDASTRRVKIGTVDIAVGNVLGETTTFTAEDEPDSVQTGTILTDIAAAPGSVDVTVIIPEPTTVALTALAAIALLRHRTRRA